MSSTEITLKTIQTYNKFPANFAEQFSRFSLEEQLDKFTGCMRPGGLILDLGSGSGRDMLALQQRGFKTIGLDLSAGLLKEAAKRNAGPLVQADMRRLPFAQHSFDGVWASASLLHLSKPDLQPALEALYNILRHGHIFIGLKQGQTEGWQGEDENAARYFVLYHPAEIELALERANFHILWSKSFRAAHNPNNTTWINIIGWTKLNTPKVGANAVIFNREGQILLTRRADNNLWCVPGGHMDIGESIEQTALREAFEETGLQVEIEGVSGMYSIQYPAHLFPEKKPRTIFVVAFRCAVQGGTLMLNDEVVEFGWFDPHSLPPDMLMGQEERIQDAENFIQF